MPTKSELRTQLSTMIDDAIVERLKRLRDVCDDLTRLLKLRKENSDANDIRYQAR